MVDMGALLPSFNIMSSLTMVVYIVVFVMVTLLWVQLIHSSEPHEPHQNDRLDDVSEHFTPEKYYQLVFADDSQDQNDNKYIESLLKRAESYIETDASHEIDRESVGSVTPDNNNNVYNNDGDDFYFMDEDIF